MCGRYVTPEESEIERYWHIGSRNSGRWIRRGFNVAPTTLVPILRESVGGQLELLPARWGLIPFWWKEETPPRFSFNARSEEAASKPMWRQALHSTRCLMPAVGWYEWNERESVRNPAGRLVHQPYYIHPTNDELLAFAGLWSVWQSPSGEEVLSCAMLTRAATPALEAIHTRMPVVLGREQQEAWLAPQLSPKEVAALVDNAGPALVGHRVSLLVNRQENDGAELIEPLTGDK